jgi:hypothetical protein
MSTRNLSEDQFGPMYHGTKAILKHGLVLPGSSGLAYATSDAGSADLFGHTKMPEGEVGPNKVYKVTPLSDDVKTKKGKFKGETHYISQSGFMVLGEHGDE